MIVRQTTNEPIQRATSKHNVDIFKDGDTYSANVFDCETETDIEVIGNLQYVVSVIDHYQAKNYINFVDGLFKANKIEVDLMNPKASYLALKSLIVDDIKYSISNVFLKSTNK
jgi:hypothetical protein